MAGIWSAPITRMTFAGNTSGVWAVQQRATYHTFLCSSAIDNLGGARLMIEGTLDGTNWALVARFMSTGSQVVRWHFYKLRGRVETYGGASQPITLQAINAVDRATQDIPVKADGTVDVTTIVPA